RITMTHDQLAFAAHLPIGPTARPPPRPIEGRVAGPARRVSMRVHHSHLSLRWLRIGAHDDSHRFWYRGASRHELQTLLAVIRIAQRLRRDRPDAGPGPRHQAADIGEFRLHGDAQVPGGGIVGDDAVGVRAFGKLRWWREWRLV